LKPKRLKSPDSSIIATVFARYGRFVALLDVIGSRATPSQTVSVGATTGTLSTVRAAADLS
jgi:hypothetical protein